MIFQNYKLIVRNASVFFYFKRVGCLLKALQSKILRLTQLKKIVKELKANRKKIVWTNGCFDIIHAGHILYLESAALLGDCLIVGLNSDESVKEIKGPSRPIIPQEERAIVLAALSCVSYIIIFNDNTPVSLLNIIKPDYYVKGGDYALENLENEEIDIVKANGGEIRVIAGVPGLSTSSIIKRIKDQKNIKSSRN